MPRRDGARGRSSVLPACLSLLTPEVAVHVDNIHWIGHASFRIEDGATQIYIDPWKVPAGSPKASVVLITHGHADHYSPDDIARIEHPGTVFVAPADVAAKLTGKTVVTASPGHDYRAGGLKVEAVPAYNRGKAFHPRSSNWLGFVVTLSTGVRVYHSGDSDAIPEMQALKVDVALMPCGGTYTMTAAEMAAAANGFEPKVLIPMHWGDIVGSKADAETVKQAFTGTTVIKTPER
jgi:L-ascorbate metabolism protein UlaG (beta-lactamase superfamily)